MSTTAKMTLMFVVFVDLIGQGLVFPIIDALVMKPASGFLPEGTSLSRRHLDYGLVIGIFFLSWFLGVVYLSKVSDSIGRKNALLVCLAGALAGYVITIVALSLNSLWLLILGRAVTGFTAGNQPIAQAAMIDGSANDADRDNYLTSAFGYGELGASAVMLTIGFALAFSSTFLVRPAQKRFDKRQIVEITLAIMLASALAVAASPVALLCFVAAFGFYVLFGVAYPTLLGIFSGSVGPEDQGWVMGVTTAVFCLAGGIMSLIGGELMNIDIKLPFYIAAAAAALGFVAMVRNRKDPELLRLMRRPAPA